MSVPSDADIPLIIKYLFISFTFFSAGIRRRTMRYPTPQLLLVSCAMMSSLFFLSLPLMITSASLCPAFSPCRKPDKSSTSAISASCNRRDFGLCITEAAFLGVITAAQPANAEPKPSASQIEDIQKLQKGLDRLDYFLSHWVEETTVCGKAA